LNEIPLLMTKAERALAAADRLLQDGDADFAVSRAYYGYFYIAEALLLSEGLEFTRHGQVVAQYGLHFAKNARLDVRFHRLLDRAFSLRQRADYDAAASLDVEIVEELIKEGREFLRVAQNWLEEQDPRAPE
jgi:uncharacterized protein (UPF0332 family)